MSLPEPAVVDLFCGIGGLNAGFVTEGFNVVAGVDSDESCSFAFEANNDASFMALDVTELDASELEGLLPR